LGWCTTGNGSIFFPLPVITRFPLVVIAPRYVAVLIRKHIVLTTCRRPCLLQISLHGCTIGIARVVAIAVVDIVSRAIQIDVVVSVEVILNICPIADIDVVANIDIAGINHSIAAVIAAAIVATATTTRIVAAAIAAAPADTHTEKSVRPANTDIPARPRVIANMHSPGRGTRVVVATIVRRVVPTGTVNWHSVVRVRPHIAGCVTHIDNFRCRLINMDIGGVVDR